MPSTNQSGGRQRREFSTLQERIGEDPARWLDCQILGSGTSRSDGRERMVRDRIDSIDDVETVRAWIAVERALERGDDGGPRRGIIDALQERERFLQEHGERPDRLPHGPRRPPEDLYVPAAGDDVDQLTADERLSQRTAVATDGGEDQ